MIFNEKSEGMWLQGSEDGEDKLLQVDTNGNAVDEVDSQGPCCVTDDGALLYVESSEMGEIATCIKRKTDEGTETLLTTEIFEDVIGIHSSLINGHILVFIGIRDDSESPFRKITRYDQNGVKIKDINFNNMGRNQTDRFLASITENKNGDIIISGDIISEVLGMDSSGEYRFMYSPPEGECIMDICTDKYGHILVAFQTSIYLLNKDGVFQKMLLRNKSFCVFRGLCLDDEHNLYVATNRGTVRVYKYLKDD